MNCPSRYSINCLKRQECHLGSNSLIINNIMPRRPGFARPYLFVSNTCINMKRDLTNNYCPPKTEAFGAISEAMLCDSPVDGGLESVEYEDWVI